MLRVGSYRLGVRYGFHAVRGLSALAPEGPFFKAKSNADEPRAVEDNCGVHLLFGWIEVPLKNPPPDSLLNVLTGKRALGTTADWWRMPDFDPAAGDIKGIWELSRFGWAPMFALAACDGKESAIPTLNAWIGAWLEQNPPYKGPNWKCGQEASIRVMHLAMASLLLGEESVTPSLLTLIQIHLQRIVPTLAYAVAQDNNHGTSEAAALFIGGAILQRRGHRSGEDFCRIGRTTLEERVQRLFEEDGSFSQYSVNYHRLALDTLSMAEIWRRVSKAGPFTAAFYSKAEKALNWLAAFCDPANGGGPNIGPNDGAKLLPLPGVALTDSRATVALAAELFYGGQPAPSASEPLMFVDPRKLRTRAAAQYSRVFNDGGYAVLRKGDASAFLRFPRFRFRPGQADALHVDLWLGGINILRDAGSFSYASAADVKYFGGTESHNTIQFDGRDQMPRVGRFLFARWLTTEKIDPLREGEGFAEFGATYRDYLGARHHRHLKLSDSALEVRDRIEGSFRKAVLRWRLAPGDWELNGSTVFNESGKLSVKCSVPAVSVGLATGWESIYYGRKTVVPVLEVEIPGRAEITSTFAWNSTR